MDSEKQFLKGDALFEEGKYKESFSIFMSCAKNGNVSCMTRVAQMYTCGEGTPCDYDKAIQWELKAIEAGDVSAMFNVGITYRIKGNIIESKHWFEKALEAGDGSGAIELAKLYMVSEKESGRVKELLTIAINSENMCESDVEEAKQYLSNIKGA